ncbi:MAG: Peptide deformylase (EC [uncultured Thiotrichaceae bacterium]|uniref:Peptide deformylase n=1 Tax=uncultured Thiotrichaceae bacterium TaxID=298394 RepID=A0A6S6TP17_9GAMM|nr:MAG: Peptide deformylase (EC [uncultured Thiotrichaceae bacterium]
MTELTILRYPDSRLRTKATPVEKVDDDIRQIIDDMFETMYAAPGIGLAATQVDIHQQIVVIDVSENKDEPLCFINPEIIKEDGTEEMEEGCLSVPEYYAKVTRAEKVTVKALDRNGAEFSIDAEELLAVCIQHEIDHLRGKVFVDYLSPMKQQRVRKKLEKVAKMAATS